MPLAHGTRLGPHEIVAPLGAGGMGEVYRARDTRLGRDVAVKVLPQHLSAHPELRARFEREARTVSSLKAAVGLADREEGKRATAETLFQAGSISKPVAAAALLREAQKGTFRLDAEVNDYLKSWKLPANELTAREKVTLERILSHGAGLTVHGFPVYAAGEAVPTVPQVLDGRPPTNTAPVRSISCQGRGRVTRAGATRSRSWR